VPADETLARCVFGVAFHFKGPFRKVGRSSVGPTAGPLRSVLHERNLFGRFARDAKRVYVATMSDNKRAIFADVHFSSRARQTRLHLARRFGGKCRGLPKRAYVRAEGGCGNWTERVRSIRQRVLGGHSFPRAAAIKV